MSRRALAAGLAAAGLAALGALAWRRLAAPAPTDEERIRALLAASARAVEERRIGDAVAPVSERFRGPGDWDRAEVKRAIAAAALRGQWVRVALAGDRIEVDGDRARAVFHAVAARSGKGRSLAELLPQEATALRVDARLEREEGGWRIVSAEWREIPLAAVLADPGDR
jgi:hypothetical protein